MVFPLGGDEVRVMAPRDILAPDPTRLAYQVEQRIGCSGFPVLKHEVDTLTHQPGL
jgi:hypothetical protein